MVDGAAAALAGRAARPTVSARIPLLICRDYPVTLRPMPSRRDQISMTEDELLAFLGEQMVMQCATSGPRGLPAHDAAVVRQRDPRRGRAALRHRAARLDLREVAEGANLERDPRATIGIEDGVLYHELRGVTFECDVELEREPERVEAYGLRLFERYAGELTPEIRDMVAQQARKRVGMRFVPVRTMSWDHGKLGGTY